MGTPVHTDDHKKMHAVAGLTFLTPYNNEGPSLLNRVVTGDEIWIHHYTRDKTTINALSSTWGNAKKKSKR